MNVFARVVINLMTNNLSKFTKVSDLFFASEENLPHISGYGKLYHNSESSRLHGLRRSIAQGELTTALEILAIAGHEDQDAIDALNLYRGVSHA